MTEKRQSGLFILPKEAIKLSKPGKPGEPTQLVQKKE